MRGDRSALCVAFKDIADYVPDFKSIDIQLGLHLESGENGLHAGCVAMADKIDTLQCGDHLGPVECDKRNRALSGLLVDEHH